MRGASTAMRLVSALVVHEASGVSDAELERGAYRSLFECSVGVAGLDGMAVASRVDLEGLEVYDEQLQVCARRCSSLDGCGGLSLVGANASGGVKCETWRRGSSASA